MMYDVLSNFHHRGSTPSNNEEEEEEIIIYFGMVDAMSHKKSHENRGKSGIMIFIDLG